MKKITVVLLFILSLCYSPVQAQKTLEVKGVPIPRTIEFKNKSLMLNGVGNRSKMFTELYILALYLSQLTQDAEYILDSDVEMAMRIHVTSSLVTSKRLSKALEDGLRKSVGESGIFKVENEMRQLEEILVKDVTRGGDLFNLVYNPMDQALWVYKNDKYQGKVNGIEFKKALFGIWLSEKPVDKDLKDELLGKFN
jgi:hypothetical protein